VERAGGNETPLTIRFPPALPAYFSFHVTSACAILRSSGAAIGKADAAIAPDLEE
jgi:hypothetical protein